MGSKILNHEGSVKRRASGRDTGRISAPRFYLRRSLRIFPAFYAYVAVVVLLAAAGLIALRPGDIAHALTYTMNYHYPAAWEVFHFWSLSVEEQFYGLWPPIVVFAGAGPGFLVCGDRGGSGC